MLQRLHKNAKTNYLLREYIKASGKPLTVLAGEFKLNIKTVRKWKHRSEVADLSSRPRRLRTNLTPEQEDLIIYERRAHKKTLFEIWDSLEEVVPCLYPMKIYRVLDRWGLSVLPRELATADRQLKRFRRYTIGYLHLDVLFTAKFTLPDGSKRRWYIFTCIDRVSKLAFVMLADRKTQAASAKFLEKVIKFYPYEVHYVLTDNGIEFSFNQLASYRRPQGRLHPFDQVCREYHIKHRTIKFKHPWTNGMVERFNRRLKTDVIRRYLFENIQALNLKLVTYVNHYNFEVRLQRLNRLTPVGFLEKNYQRRLIRRPQRIVN